MGKKSLLFEYNAFVSCTLVEIVNSMNGVCYFFKLIMCKNKRAEDGYRK
jgi:hypothetical protein